MPTPVLSAPKLPPSALTLPVITTPPPAEPVELVRLQTCPKCGTQHESLFRLCDTCAQALHAPLLESEAEKEHTHEQQARVNAWLDMCPPDYRSTNWRDHPELSQECRRLAKEWQLPPRDSRSSERGLLIHGPSGRGKTRAMFEILRRLHFSGVPCMAVEAVTFAEHAVTATHLSSPVRARQDAQAYLRRAKTVRVLFFDDLGKEGGTSMPGFARAFHDLLEHRKAHHLPLLVTTERVGDELAALLGTNYADGIVRRLREMCAIHATDELSLND